MSILRRAAPVRQQLRSIFGSAAEGAVQGFEAGMQIRDRRQQREDRQTLRDIQERRVGVQERTLELEEEQARREREQRQQFDRAFSEIMQGPERQQATEQAEQHRQRAGGLGMVQTLANLSKVPKSVRGPQVDAFAARFQQRTGRPIASNVIETLKKGSTEDLTLVSRNLARMATENQQFNARQATEILSDPGRSATIFTQAGKLAPVLQEQDELEEQGGQAGPTRERARRQDGQRAPEQAGGQPSGQEERQATFPQVQQINQQIGQFRRLAQVAPNDELRERAEFAIESRETARNEALNGAESNVMRATQNMPDDQALRQWQDFESQIIAANAPQEQINRVQDRVERLRPDEEDQGRLSFTPTFQRVAAGLFGPSTVTNETGEFDGSRLSREQIQEVNTRIEEMGLEKERAGALAGRKAEATALARKRSDELFATTSLIGELAGAPEGAVGVRRALANLTGSTVGQVPGLSGLADSVTEFFTGGFDQQQLSALNTQFRSIVGQVASQFTGDDGGRLSNQDLERVDRALPAQQTWTTKDQVMGSLKELASIQELAMWKQRFRAGDGLDFDANSTESVEAKARDYMRRFNMNGQEAVDLVKDVATLGDIHGNF